MTGRTVPAEVVEAAAGAVGQSRTQNAAVTAAAPLRPCCYPLPHRTEWQRSESQKGTLCQGNEPLRQWQWQPVHAQQGPAQQLNRKSLEVCWLG
jgi:hypothetical protein